MNEVERELSQRTTGKRLIELDSLRGVAAFIVLFWHLRYAFFMGYPRWFLRPFVDGHSAVVLFFALSGYVLSLPYWNGKTFRYGPYLVRRLFRIYVPYAAAVCVALVVARPLLNAQLPLSPWFYETWHTPLTRRLIVRQFLMMSISPAINTAFWSLRYEMVMSLIFPILCPILRRLGVLGAVVLGVLCMVVGLELIRVENWYGIRSEAGRLILWSSPFIFGAVLAWQRKAVHTFYERIDRPLRVVLCAVCLGGYFSFYDALIIPCASVLIVYAQHGRAKQWLSTRIPEFLGEISYSLYLVHGTVLFAVLILLYGKVSMLALTAIYLVVSIAFAKVFFMAIEKPAMDTGKKLTTVSAGTS